MIIEVANSFSRVTSSDEEEIDWLQDYLTLRIKTWKFGSYEEEVLRLVGPASNKFPTGFIGKIHQAAQDEGVKIEYLDRRAKPILGAGKADLGWLRDYQLAAVNAVFDAEKFKTQPFDPANMGRGILWLPTGCLAGETIIECNRAGKSFKIPISTLVERFNGKRITWGKRRNTIKGHGMYWDSEIPTMVRSRDNFGSIRLQRLAGAIASGIKRTFTLTTANGQSIRATADHRFLTANGWRRLGELGVDDLVFVEVPLSKTNKTRIKKSYPVTDQLPAHPFAGRRRWGCSVPKHRLIAEARINQIPLKEFLSRVRTNDIGGLIFLDPQKYIVHHLDGNHDNPDPDNLAILLRDGTYERLHGENGGWRHVTARTAPTKIVSIEEYGDEPTFDLVLADEPHNFLANGIVVHNSGKTEIAVALTLRFPIRWLFLVHRTNLMDQAAERFEKRCNEKAGRIGEGVWDPERFTAATFQTVHARLADPACAEWLAGIEGVIFDEGHTLPAGTFYCVAMRMMNAFFRVAMSGTPLARGDKRSAFVIGATGSVLYRIKPELLIDAGVLSRPTIRLATVSQITLKQTWSEVYRECVVRSPVRNAKIVQLAKKAMKPCLVFVKELKHGKALEKQIRAEGMSVEFVWGAAELERRKAAIHRLVHGDVDVLIASVIFNEGVDIPELNSVVIASGGKSIISALQRIGRGMRVTDDKKTFEVWDINDLGNRWLERHTRQRLKAYIGEGHETSVIE